MHGATTDAATIALPDLPTPEGSARWPDLMGFDHVLADGRIWRLPHFIPSPDPIWDKLYDDGVICGDYLVPDVLLAAAKLLLAHYDLPADFAAWLVARAEPATLGDAVNWALFGRADQIRGYSDWVESSLLSNGLDPARVPRHLLREVLDRLVATGRAMPAESYTSAGIAAAKRAGLRAVNREIDDANAERRGERP